MEAPLLLLINKIGMFHEIGEMLGLLWLGEKVNIFTVIIKNLKTKKIFSL
ncbi:MAG: hypothetical protein EORIYHIE_002383 [Candidatus Fervidibacter sp.]